ncbi:hypothetical protein ACPCTO_37265 [Streptomyces olivoreticuli]
MASVMGLLEERESAARVRVENLQAEADRILAELAEAEVVLERRVIARAELAEALATGDDAGAGPVAEVRDQVPVAETVKSPVAGSVVRRSFRCCGAVSLWFSGRPMIDRTTSATASAGGGDTGTFPGLPRVSRLAFFGQGFDRLIHAASRNPSNSAWTSRGGR